MTAAQDIGAQFRALHHRGQAFVIPNPWDRGSARLLASLGFEALATSSAAFAWSRGKGDHGVTRDEKLAHCRDLAGATTLPVSADLGIGFATTPDGVAETIRRAAETGLAGASIEDAPAPDQGPAFDRDLAVERIAAAVEAARAAPGDFVLTARCEHFAYGGKDLDLTIDRLQRFCAAGADVVHAPGLTDLEMIGTVCASVDRPVNVLTGFRGMDVGPDDLAAAGVVRISIGTQLARIAYGALLTAARELKDSGQVVEHETAVRSSDIHRHVT